MNNQEDPKYREKKEPIDVITKPFQRFIQTEASSGVILIIVTVIALVMANSVFGEAFHHFWKTHIALSIGDFSIDKSFHFWINDALMVIFFFVVGLEIKREIMIGELSSAKNAALPIVAALGGMVVPALIYTFFNLGGPGEDGWGIPMATDIAFAIGIMTLLGKRVPLSLKIFLTALAIVDDLGAVLVIAFFYTADLNLISLGIGIAILGVMGLANIAGARHPLVFGLLGIALWFAFLYSGVHTTVAGVLAALTIPVRTKIKGQTFLSRLEYLLKRFKTYCSNTNRLYANTEQQEILGGIHDVSSKAQSPMHRMEHDTRPWAMFLIIPVFALSNAGVKLESELLGSITEPVALGVILGLFLGKPIGIALFSWVSVKMNIASMPTKANWRQLIGIGFLAGIGFTMSLFINGLAFDTQLLSEMAKMGIIFASLISGIIGWIILSTGKTTK
ncbi:MAG: Na+/H+ antiporter NhaA [Bacteroidales bacterium]|nr:Na+/H+ antiporter NhaA [Bacteroidales bacterium]